MGIALGDNLGYPLKAFPNIEILSNELDTASVGSYIIDTANSPFSTPGIIYMLKRSDMNCQIFIGTSSVIIGMRTKNSASASWTAWKQVTFV